MIKLNTVNARAFIVLVSFSVPPNKKGSCGANRPHNGRFTPGLNQADVCDCTLVWNLRQPALVREPRDRYQPFGRMVGEAGLPPVEYVWETPTQEQARSWRSDFAAMDELPEEIRQVFDGFSYGCLAAETNIGVVHVCYAADGDIEGSASGQVSYQWQLVKTRTAPPIRLLEVLMWVV
jgi:hypothetical protein